MHSSVDTIVEVSATFMFWFRKQELGVPPHVENAYIAQEEEQPSPSKVFPSSQASFGNIMIPSPQVVEQSPFAFLGN